MTKCMDFVNIFSSASGTIFLEYLDLYLMEWAEYVENHALSGGVSAILQSGLILENVFHQNICTLSR